MDENVETFGTKTKSFMKKYGRRIGTAALVVGAFALGAYLQREFEEDDTIEMVELEDGSFVVKEKTPETEQ